MDSELNELLIRAAATRDLCDAQNYARACQQRGQGPEAANILVSEVLAAHFLGNQLFPSHGQGVIAMMSWLQALRKDLLVLFPDLGEYLLQAYLQYYGLSFETNEAGYFFDLHGLHWQIMPRQDDLSFKYNVWIGTPRFEDLSSGPYDNLLNFDNLHLENVLRLLAQPPILGNSYSHYHHLLNLGELEWVRQLPEYGIAWSFLNRHQEPAGNWQRRETRELIDLELEIHGKKYNAILSLGVQSSVSSDARAQLRIFDYFPGFRGEVTHRGGHLFLANSPYDVYRLLSFRVIMEKALKEFTTQVSRKYYRETEIKLEERKAHLSRQKEDQYVLSLHWAPYEHKSRYLLEIQNNFGECIPGYKILLYRDTKYRGSEYVARQHPIGVFRKPEDVLSYIRERDALTRSSKKHPMKLKDLYQLALVIGEKHGFTAEDIKLISGKETEQSQDIINFYGYRIRPTRRRYRIKGKMGIRIVPTYIIERGHTTAATREDQGDYEIVPVGFADQPEQVILLTLENIEADRKQAEAEAQIPDDIPDDFDPFQV